MSFGKNLQFLRKMHNSMTQEELAERMGVSRQTISKWESETAYPEMEKAFELCQFFFLFHGSPVSGKYEYGK